MLLAVDVDDLFFFGDGGQGLGGVARVDADVQEGVGGGVQLAETAVDEDQRGKGLVSSERRL